MLKQKTNSSNVLQANGIDHKSEKMPIHKVPSRELTLTSIQQCPIEEKSLLSTSASSTTPVKESPRKSTKKKGSKLKYLIDQSSYIGKYYFMPIFLKER